MTNRQYTGLYSRNEVGTQNQRILIISFWQSRDLLNKGENNGVY